MKARTIQTLRRLLKAQKAYAMYAGRYPPPYTAKAFEKRGPVPFRSMSYGTTILEINALEDAIKELSLHNAIGEARADSATQPHQKGN
jgi:hypothetical protein